ncbi:hypothetical protein CROQUDRAFT_103296 [Cronartium quercuum f. sp. fusiforme G11]|uniref:Uncharacterized protein n=1 Tax=Cronartium quercuum f. sp. fusiforme G11 TaxID=708437 RepID=A0A9P6NYW6_9BASI|nr:hypothetical protein CROQUDRAFT_103296 [Cronartium quercuum f. sp. fusiforme G11]
MFSTMTELQLAAWIAITSERSDSLNQPSEHATFIRNCINALDASGFKWTKNSIESAFLQLGPPGCASHNSLNDAASLVKDDCNGVEALKNIACEIPRRSLNLLNLPIEILDQVITFVHDFAATSIQKKPRLTQIDKEDGSGTYDCYMHDQEPILCPFKALASVNRKLYNLCARRLWKRLKFPTDLSVPLSLWTEEILPRHGAHVRRLTLLITEVALRVPWHLAYQTNFYDNTYSNPSSNLDIPISPQAIICLLQKCPNITELKLEFPEVDEEFNADGVESPLGSAGAPGWPNGPATEIEHDAEDALAAEIGQDADIGFEFEPPAQNGPAPVWHPAVNDEHNQRIYVFMLHLSPFIARLTKLRHLELQDFSGCCSSHHAIIPLIAHLPLLESLSCVGFLGPGNAQDHVSLGHHIAQLKHLSQLTLKYNSSLNSSWCRLSWPLLLSDVSIGIEHPTSITPVECLQLVQHFSPNLTKFELTYRDERLLPSSTIASQWALEQPLNLPKLTDLRLQTSSMAIIANFMNCQALESLTYSCFSNPLNLPLLLDTLSHDCWPELKFINLEGPSAPGSIPDHRSTLETRCRAAHIKLTVVSRIPRDPLID